MGYQGKFSGEQIDERLTNAGDIPDMKEDIDAIRRAVGTPLVASTAAGMINKTKIYVYVGSETGYTYGHWYYWDGSAWADGGVYNSTALETDKTLSVENMAADAKVTGEKISDLKSAIDYQKEWSYNDLIALDNGVILLNGAWSLGNISNGGNLYVGDDYKKRAISTEAMKLQNQATLKIAEGYRVKIAYYYTNELKYGSGDNPNLISITDFATGSIDVDANTWFDILIAMSTEPETDADLNTLVQSVWIESVIDGRIDALAEEISETNNRIDEIKEIDFSNILSLDNGEIALNGAWSLGNISNGGNLYVGDDYKKRAISTEAMKLQNQATLKIAEGYRVKIAYYYTNELKYGSGDNPNLISITDFATGSIDVDANTWFDILIAMSTDPEGTADLQTLVNSVYVESNIDRRLSALESNSNSILPQYWIDYLDTKYPALWEKDALIGSGGDSFVFITDVHYARNQLKSPSIIQNVIKNTSVKKLFNGGDTLDEGDTISVAFEKLSKWQAMFDDIRVFNIVGNHDSNNYDGNNTANAITKGQYYGIMVKPSEQWIDTDGQIYYCVDNESQKIRYICVAIESFENMNVGGNQRLWFQTKLTEKNEDWSIVVLQHRIWGSTVDTIPTRSQNVIDAINEVYSNIQAKFVGIIAGHTHLDYDTTENTNGYLLIACNCDTLSGTNSGYTRAAGTTSEQSFDVFYIDKTNEKLYAVRIGAGDSSVGSGTGIREWSY